MFVLGLLRSFINPNLRPLRNERCFSRRACWGVQLMNWRSSPKLVCPIFFFFFMYSYLTIKWYSRGLGRSRWYRNKTRQGFSIHHCTHANPNPGSPRYDQVRTCSWSGTANLLPSFDARKSPYTFQRWDYRRSGETEQTYRYSRCRRPVSFVRLFFKKH